MIKLSTGKLLTMTTGLVVAAATTSSYADVLCRSKSGSVHVRTVCKIKEAPVDPVTLGLTLTQRSASKTSSNTDDSLQVQCAPGEHAIGGGYQLAPGDTASFLVSENSPFFPEQQSAAGGWSVLWYNPQSVPQTVTVNAQCISGLVVGLPN